jgi:hypothetical protein
MTTDTSTENAQRHFWWQLHDVVVGLLAGFGTGIIAGLFANRLVENNAIVLAIGVAGAVVAIYVLMQSHIRSQTFVNAVVVVNWVLLVLSGLFLTALVQAILDFE